MKKKKKKKGKRVEDYIAKKKRKKKFTRTQAEKKKKKKKKKKGQVWKTSWPIVMEDGLWIRRSEFKALHPNVSMHILHTVL